MSLESYIKKITFNSVTHDFYHLKRTGIGAKWFAKKFDMDKHEQKLAYISGLLHDIIRPPSSDEHASLCAKKSKIILNKFGFDSDDINKIYNAIEEHGSTPRTPLSVVLYLSDKVLELMGSYIVFRRCAYIGESEDYKNEKFENAIITQFQKRMEKYPPEKFERYNIDVLVHYQFGWVTWFFRAFKQKEEWAYELARYCYESAKQKTRLDKIIKNYRPSFEKGHLYKKEALKYISGKKFRLFNSML